VVKRFQSAGLLRNSHSEGFANFRSCWASELEQARRSTKEIAGVAPAYDTWRGGGVVAGILEPRPAIASSARPHSNAGCGTWKQWLTFNWREIFKPPNVKSRLHLRHGSAILCPTGTPFAGRLASPCNRARFLESSAERKAGAQSIRSRITH
jgi:hypothetical protein